MSREVSEIQQEYIKTCTEIGDKEYRREVMKFEIQELMKKASELNKEAAELSKKAEEDAAEKAKLEEVQDAKS